MIACVLDRNRHRHVLDDVVEEVLGAAELCGGGIESFQLTEVHERNRQARKRQRQEQTEANAGTLPHQGVQEGRHRHVDDERAHDVVEMPLRLVGLQGVMTADATLFPRHRGIDGAEHPFAADVDEL